MLPLLLEICFPCLLSVKPGSALIDGLFFDRYPPFPQYFKDAISLDGTIWRGKKPPKIGMFHEKAGVVL